MPFEIPIVSLAGINDSARKPVIAKEFEAAARGSGFMLIVDHGIAPEIGPDNKNWGAFGHGPNVLPTEEQVAGGCPTLTEYYNECLALSKALMEIAAISLDLPPTTFAEICDEPNAALRLLHYPANLTGTGATAHTDFGFLTILATNGVTGLEVFTPQGTWEPVPAVENAFVINLGDLLSLFTGGDYKSDLHRVQNVSGEERYSIPFFLDGANQALVKPIKGSLGMVPITVEEHLRNRLDGGLQARARK
ncbi:hypothetical protein RQP46_007855 [Phenoliferia psychrophenolica]